MADSAQLQTQITAQLDQWLETEFTFLKVEAVAAQLAALPALQRDFALDWIRRIAATHITLAWQFAQRAADLLARMETELIVAWATHACDTYDRAGLQAALTVIHEVEQFDRIRYAHQSGVFFDDLAPVLSSFLRGLSGRALKLGKSDASWTDSESVYLPTITARFADRSDNFALAKCQVVLRWAETRFGSLRPDLVTLFADYPDPAHAAQQFHALERLRLSARLSNEFPGLGRDLQRLRQQSGSLLTPAWSDWARQLVQPEARVETSLALLPAAYAHPVLSDDPFMGELRPQAVAAIKAARRDRDKARLRVALAQLASELKPQRTRSPNQATFQAEVHEEGPHLDLQLTLDGIPIAPPAEVRQLALSVHLDFGDIPPEYLVAAGDGEYDTRQLGEQGDPSSVWQGTYHEAGATLFPEWDHARQLYRKNWCVMREAPVKQGDPAFVTQTLVRHAPLVAQLRKTFAAMQSVDRRLKRQSEGDEVDLDALIEALADIHDGREMTDRLMVRRERADRDIAVAFLVDMSGSTRGWINEAEREALVLLCESLEKLGDRYAIYGFTSLTRKRCEIFPIKRFDEVYDTTIQARIAGIEAQEYTRMGFAIRHMTAELTKVAARTRIMINLSDGKPDDYFDGYRGPYGIEDTRMALIEARRAGVHAFCITIDREARDYLPRLYGPARYVILDDVRQLPRKTADTYRKLTT